MSVDYKATLNLPVTDFPMKADLARKEPEVQKKWDEENLYSQIRKARRGAKKYILHDGPPYPTGDLHIGTGLNKILKDLIVRYYTMRGYDAPFIPGWDCHGLPIEHRVMQSLTKGKDPGKLDKLLAAARDESRVSGQLSSKTKALLSSLVAPENETKLTPEETAQFSANKPMIRKLCRHYAELYVNLQKAQFKALGVLGDWDDPYLTLDPKYESAIIDTFARLVERGYVYRSLKPIHWCMRCQTALAEAELEYDEETSPSIFVNFRLIDNLSNLFSLSPNENVNILIWTTTPWTIPANLAIALHPESHYAAIRYTNPLTQKNEVTIMAQSLVESVMEKVGVKTFESLDSVLGKELAGKRYQHPLREVQGIIVTADYVSLKEGTGCVHTAPGHGLEDYITGLKHNLPIFSPVDAAGRFTQEAGEFQGQTVTQANPRIIERLQALEAILHKSTLRHSYPHCWRCKESVIFRATKQWFIDIDHQGLRAQALEAVKNAKWVPEWGGERLGGMIHLRPDWCISRQRAWGVPIPAFYCTNCEEVLLTPETAYFVRDIFGEKGSNSWFSLEAKDLLPPNTRCKKCGGTNFSKEMDIFDVWFESGSSHHAVLHGRNELSFPADMYLEGTDQHRGWFQLSLLPSVGAWGSAPFRTVLTHGFVVDEKGEKMSKSLGNFISVEDALKRFGADIIRLWASSQDYRQDINTSMALMGRMSDPYRRIRNTFRFLLGNLHDFDPRKDSIEYTALPEIDRWALHKTQRLIETVTRAFEGFEFHKVHHSIHHFCAVDMSAFYFDVLKDRLYTWGKDSTGRRAAQTALQEVLQALVKLSAPLLVHTAEEAWSAMKQKDEDLPSVHLATWPQVKTQWIDVELEKRWAKLIRIREGVLRGLETLRENKSIGKSLEAYICFYVPNKELYDFLKIHESALVPLLMVSEVQLLNKCPEASHENWTFTQDSSLSPPLELDTTEYWIEAKVTKNRQCERCWNYFESVGKDSRHPALCSRCVEVVETL